MSVVHYWSYIKTTILGDDQLGPIAEPEFVAGIRSGIIKPKTKVHSSTRTGNQWAIAQNVPLIQKVFEDVAKQAREKKQTDEAVEKLNADLESERLARDKETKKRAKTMKKQAQAIASPEYFIQSCDDLIFFIKLVNWFIFIGIAALAIISALQSAAYLIFIVLIFLVIGLPVALLLIEFQVIGLRFMRETISLLYDIKRQRQVAD